ncbi:MAG: hypothetical protein ACI88A_004586 [Paraglaciecola sp.]|jgi:hypothetical protein
MSSYKISTAQKAQIEGQGFTLLPAALPSGILKRWQKLAQQLETNALDAHERSKQTHGACVIQDPVGPRLMRYDDVLGIDPSAVIELLACPAMIAVARELCGRNAIPLQLDILYKHQHPHPVIMWHQGAPHPRSYAYFNIGIYLDDANPNDGCLQYVPNTQHELQDIAGLAKNHGWAIPGAVEQPAKAGDILIQDMMILHGSPPKRSPGTRRTIYVELRTVEGVLESEAQSSQWIELRKRWMGLVLKHAEAGSWPEEWQQDYPTDLGSLQMESENILRYHEPPIPAVYGIQDFDQTDYPVPADMRNPESEGI